MNKLLSSIMLATLTMLTALPFSVAPAAAFGGAILSMDQSQYSATVGSTFQVTVLLTGQQVLVGYDFSIFYNNAVLSCIAYDDHGPMTLIGPFLATGKAFSFASACTDPIAQAEGVARSAYSLSGGMSTNVFQATLAVITFKVIGDGNSNLAFATEPSRDLLVCAVGSATGSCAPHTDINSVFLVAPTVNLVPFIVDSASLVAAPVASPVRHLFKGETTVVYGGTIQLSPSDVRAGFGAMFLTATDPLGNQLFAQSNVVFMFPGQTASVTATIDFSSMPTIGTWSVTATVLECANPAICIPASSGPALFFKVKA